jgi:uncharacterized protein YdeI (YjbR/CyaY-like superfamily)
MASVTDAVFFKSAADWRRWLEKNHDRVDEIVVGLVKVGSGLAGIGYREALDEALCYGWIDGVRRSIDDRRWTIRFTPRRKGSIWSAVNQKRIAELERDGRLAEPGRRVFHTRDPAKQQRYSFENRDAALDPAEEKQFRANKAAWKHFSEMPKSYRHPAVWWVVSAKRPETRERRLATLIGDSAAGRKIKPLSRPGGR